MRRTVRAMRSEIASPKREAVLQELELVGASKITDVLWWDQAGNVSMKPSDSLPEHVKRSIKKIKVKAGENGNDIEIEMHDKLRALSILAKHHGLMEVAQDENRPSIIGINLHGPAVTSYEVKEKDTEEAQSSRKKSRIEKIFDESDPEQETEGEE